MASAKEDGSKVAADLRSQLASGTMREQRLTTQLQAKEDQLGQQQTAQQEQVGVEYFLSARMSAHLPVCISSHGFGARTAPALASVGGICFLWCGIDCAAKARCSAAKPTGTTSSDYTFIAAAVQVSGLQRTIASLESQLKDMRSTEVELQQQLKATEAELGKERNAGAKVRSSSCFHKLACIIVPRASTLLPPTGTACAAT